jgi:dUTP pyrophosphatase
MSLSSSLSSFDFPRFVLNDYYLLNIYLTPEVPDAVVEKYKQLAETTNSVLEENSKDYKRLFDSGIDLFNIKNQCVTGKSLSNKIDLGINCSMLFVNNSAAEKKITHCGYYLYPRSSTGSKTPLRLSYSVGIIDSGYRGNIFACFDNNGNDDYNVVSGDRLVQLCSPNITYPTLINIVSTSKKLEMQNSINRRLKGGFGSTGN